MYKLKIKDETEYNSIEAYIEKVLNKQAHETEWFPVDKALCVGAEDDQDVLQVNLNDNVENMVANTKKFKEQFFEFLVLKSK